MRIKHSILLDIGLDADMKDLVFQTDDTLAQVVIDGYTKVNVATIAVIAGATEAVPLGDVAVLRGMYLKADQDCVLKLNGGIESISLKRAAAGTNDRAKFFAEMSMTGATITAGATAVNVVCVVWGDPTA